MQSDLTATGLHILRNTIVNPAGAGISVQLDFGAGDKVHRHTYEDIEIVGNTIRYTETYGKAPGAAVRFGVGNISLSTQGNWFRNMWVTRTTLVYHNPRVPYPQETGEPTAPGGLVLAINAGGPAYVDGQGTLYQADWGFTGGGAHQSDLKRPMALTQDDELYAAQREGPAFSYALPLATGTYQVTLLFAEKAREGPGRTFDVLAVGQMVLPQMDVFRAAGRRAAYETTFTVPVTDGALHLQFVRVGGNPILSGLRVTKKE
jgi:hypothetical protein